MNRRSLTRIAPAVLAAAAASAALAVAGCGDGTAGGSANAATPEPATVVYVDSAAAIVHRLFARIGSDAGSLVGAGQGEAAARAAIRRMHGLSPPAGLQAAHGDILAALRELRDGFEELPTDVRAGIDTISSGTGGLKVALRAAEKARDCASGQPGAAAC